MGKHWRKYNVGAYRLGSLFNKKLGAYEAVVCWTDETGPHRRRLGVFSETEGRARVDVFVGKLEAIADRSAITVKQIWDAYLADRKKDGKLTATFEYNWKALEPRFGHLHLADINNDVCRDYAQKRLENGRTRTLKNGKARRYEIHVGTVWTELTRLRTALNWAEDNNVIAKAPKVWVPRKPDPKDRVLSLAEFMQLLGACTMPHLRLFVIIAITTGARSEAICQLAWSQVDFEAGTIDFREKPQINPLTKRARKARAKAPMTTEARASLLDAYEGRLTDNVIEWDGAPVKKIRKAYAAAVVRAGLEGVTPHTLRHTVATWLDEGGVPMERISKLLGHRHVDTTRLIYSKPSVETLRSAAELIDQRIGRNSVQTTELVPAN